MTELKPGRDLDCKIAEKVFGFEWGSVGHKHLIKSPGGCGTYECQRLHEKPMPHYSTDIAAAWAVFEKLPALGAVFKAGSPLWGCSVDDDHSVRGLSAPHAICLAALRAVGEKK